PHKLYSNIIKPVALAPGCDRLSTRPDPTGSGAMINTMGMVWVTSPPLPGIRPRPQARLGQAQRVLLHAFVLQFHRLNPSVPRPAGRPRAPTQMGGAFPEVPQAALYSPGCLPIPLQKYSGAASAPAARAPRAATPPRRRGE